MMMPKFSVPSDFSLDKQVVLFEGNCLELLATIPDGSVQLVVTSPPYNLGKSYERKDALGKYLQWQDQVIAECIRVLRPEGSICWQVGNYVEAGAVVPLDIMFYPSFANRGLKLRNRIIWYFEHGLHCSRRLSGRHETILWFTKTDKYIFDLNPIRVPQKYPGKKYFKGPKAGQYSCNPLGKNPGDVWAIPNVKNNHVEKTIHPCQFPIELVERLVLSMTQKQDWVLDPFAGVGSALVAALKSGRRAVGSELLHEYCAIAEERINQSITGMLKSRPMHQPIYDPKRAGKALMTRPAEDVTGSMQFQLLESIF
ncbi:MAG: site-specific DNA-methyltransferase [Burkholderiaceae bacterium]|jgi:adenine-specific DNA-methyltransferase|nr:site-specific DNA-methyltransferase [Burkholderiaceae bacterium]